MSSSDSLSPDSVVVATPDHISSNLAGEEIILDLNTDTYYGLDPIGTDIWRLVSSPRQVRAICDTLQAEYDVDRSRLERDVLRLLDDMRQRDLVKQVS